MTNWNNTIMTAFETLGGKTYLIRVYDTEQGGFSPQVTTANDEVDGPRAGTSVYIGGEDDEDDETPEAAMETGRRLLRDRFERGHLDA